MDLMDQMTQRAVSNANGTVMKPITGRHVLWGFIVFFGLIFAMNGVFLYYALSTHTGLDTTNAYRRGLDYNSRLAAEKRQNRLGWQAALTLAPQRDRLTLIVKSKTGLPVSYLDVSALLGRPATDKFDHKLVLKEDSPGRYEADFAPLDAGNWIVTIEATDQTRKTDPIVYRLRKRLWLEPVK